MNCICSPSGSTTPATPTPTPLEVATLIYTAGPEWNLDLTPEEQDLAEHFAYVGGLFDEGSLLAYGPMEDGRGLYVFAAEHITSIDDVVAGDPGSVNGVLALDTAGGWSLMMEDLGAASTSPLFLLDYHPGPAWVEGTGLFEQPLDEHLAYVGRLFGEGTLLAGGPVSDQQGRYLVAAADGSAAEAIVNADPGVTTGTFEPTVTAWATIQRQSSASR